MFKAFKKKAGKDKEAGGGKGEALPRLDSNDRPPASNGHGSGSSAGDLSAREARPQQPPPPPAETYQKPPRKDREEREREQREADNASTAATSTQDAAPALPDYMTDANAVLEDKIPWRHGSVPDYSAANRNFAQERTNVWPPGSLEDLVSNLVKNWEKEASYKTRLGDWRTIDQAQYRFSCNGGREYTADEMMQIGTYNALIQEAAFYSAKHTSFEESHEVFRRAMPGGFAWEVTEVYSGPPVVAFKWRHWGRMTGKLVCPIGPDTKLEADPTNQEVEIFGVCVCHLEADFKISKLEIFYDPHELMASLVDARNLNYRSPDMGEKPPMDVDMAALNEQLNAMGAEDAWEASERDGARSLRSDSLASSLPSDAALLAGMDKPSKPLPGSRCPFPMH